MPPFIADLQTVIEGPLFQSFSLSSLFGPSILPLWVGLFVPRAVPSNRGPRLTHALSLIDDCRLPKCGPQRNFSINLVLTQCNMFVNLCVLVCT